MHLYVIKEQHQLLLIKVKPLSHKYTLCYLNDSYVGRALHRRIDYVKSRNR